ncbi:MAG: N-acetylmuramoyl-L-alanine amidase, partial [Prevotella bivia]|nr:N-acetylmuramoyl-L-alanine amidase [Prevotella bivia]
KGQATHFKVNQKMGGGTWVYLGTFDFDAGSSILNSVVLTNHSSHRGVITADAVRFGGGMGNIVRGGTTSGLPRTLEGARYYAQWAGAPWDIVSKSNGSNDYNDDINARSLMTNWLAAGSTYVPGKGKKVPIDLSLAIHSDAGIAPNGSYVGTLGIYTTQEGDDHLGEDLSRSVSKTLAENMVSNLKKDIDQVFHINWNTRSVRDRNYSETRLPDVPSMILETMSHQNFNDMKLGQDPNFKFVVARSIYKTILRYEASMHNTSYTVQPLAPILFRLKRVGANKVRLQWNAVNDPYEPTAVPTSYNVYTAIGNGGFDNGINISGTSCEIEMQMGKLYSFRITACNRGGESFPTEVLSAYNHPDAKQTVLVVNGFNRLSSPAIIDSIGSQGFNLEADPGVTYGKTIGWSGQQSNFDPRSAGKEGAGALGYGGEELVGKMVAGNDFNYVRTHAEAIQTAGRYNVVSCSGKAVENGLVRLTDYDAVDIDLGLEKDDGHSLYYYKAFRPAMQQQISNYLQHHGNLFVNGAYLASDMKLEAEKQWLANNLKITYAGSNLNNYSAMIKGLGTSFDIYRTINADHYGAYTPDNILPANNTAIAVMAYADGNNAAVAYKGVDYRTFSMAFPLECIKDANTRNKIMRGILAYLLQ